MQRTLFPGLPDDPPSADKASVEPAVVEPALTELAAELPAELRLGTASWNYPGWAGLVWARRYPEAALSRHGLSAYARHPLFRTVSLDRGFYRPLTIEQFAGYAACVPEDFRFMVKAPSLVTDAVVRDARGRGNRPNDFFLDANRARREFVEPARQGLGAKLGVLVFQLSPLPAARLAGIAGLIERLHAFLGAFADLRTTVPECVVTVEVRDAEWLTPSFTRALLDTGSAYCMALHAKMPQVDAQLPILRALWPGPLVCRWNLNPVHGAFGYEEAQDVYAPYDRIVDADLRTRAVLARVIAGTVGAGQRAYVSLSNKAEGSAPLSVIALAQAVRDLLPG